MPAIVLRVAGADFDVDAFLSGHPDLVVDAVWHIGVVGRVGKPPTTSGFNTCLGDDDDKVVALDRMRASLQRLGPAIVTAGAMGATGCVDIGVFLGEAFSRTIFLNGDDLHRLVELGLVLEFSAY
ncbi:MAG TPA: hypothetical protein VGF99_18555 [Myxococcota bacterium]